MQQTTDYRRREQTITGRLNCAYLHAIPPTDASPLPRDRPALLRSGGCRGARYGRECGEQRRKNRVEHAPDEVTRLSQAPRREGGEDEIATACMRNDTRALACKGGGEYPQRRVRTAASHRRRSSAAGLALLCVERYCYRGRVTPFYFFLAPNVSRLYIVRTRSLTVQKPTRPDKRHRLPIELVYKVREQAKMAIRYEKNHILDDEYGDRTDYTQA